MRRSSPATRPARRSRRERGFVVLWMAMVLLLLIGVAAFAVDLVHAYVVGQEAQNAADAAALGGVTALQNDLTGTAAINRAADLADKNGFASGVTATPTGANQLTVEVKQDVDTWFAKIFGIDTLSVDRTAVAEYDPPVAMGSPANNIGDVPAGSCTDAGFLAGPPVPCVSAHFAANANQNLFAQVVGPDAPSSQGNPYTTRNCSSFYPTDGCTGPGAGNNTLYDGAEYFFISNDMPGGDITPYVYDGAYVNTGFGFCDTTTNGITNADPARYAKNSPYCAADLVTGGLAGIIPPVGTQFELLGPDGDLDPTNNPVLCSTGIIPGEEPPNGTPITNPITLANFEKWQPICPAGSPTIHGATADKFHPYEIRVTTSATGEGTNNFSLMALHDPGTPPTNGLAVYTSERLPLFASKNGATGPAAFYVARVLPSSRPRTLNLDLFDLGDSIGGGGTGSLQVFAVPDYNAGTEVPLAGCTFTQPVGSPPDGSNYDLAPPWGSAADIVSAPTCGQVSSEIQYDATAPGAMGSHYWQGQWVTISIPIPAKPAYSCTTNLFENCWIKLRITPNRGQQLGDATTWNAHMAGGPVRLVG
ncbi:MAG TPA: pilus assembly protein TadG-related protein [Acidimicrobiia bacterium]|nr:pilus assembly protein TadG-related protein [Acidimicrobiia bacterium]